MTDNQIVNQNEIMEENTAPETVNYDENQIQVLEGLEEAGIKRKVLFRYGAGYRYAAQRVKDDSYYDQNEHCGRIVPLGLLELVYVGA